MIAQVHTGKGPVGPMPEEMRKAGEEVVSQARTFPGCVGVLAMSDPASGDSMSITLFRDSAALDAYEAFSKEKIAELHPEDYEAMVGSARVYSVVIARL